MPFLKGIKLKYLSFYFNDRLTAKALLLLPEIFFIFSFSNR